MENLEMQELKSEELMEVEGGIGVVAGSLIVAGVIFLAGVGTGVLESYNENK